MISVLNFPEMRLIFAQICTGVTSSPKLSDKLSWNSDSRVFVDTVNGSSIGFGEKPELIKLAAVLNTWCGP